MGRGLARHGVETLEGGAPGAILSVQNGALPTFQPARHPGAIARGRSTLRPRGSVEAIEAVALASMPPGSRLGVKGAGFSPVFPSGSAERHPQRMWVPVTRL